MVGEVATRAGRVTLVDDYGHHPTEIEATVDAVRQGWPGRRLVLAFQPHRYTRTRDLIDDFGRALSAADLLLVTEVYAAGEEPIANADGRAICRAVRGRGRLEPVFVEDVRELPAALAGVIADRDVVLTMGAGSIGAVAHELPAQARRDQREGRAMSRFTIAREFADRVQRDEPMSRHTSWHVGGPADAWFSPRDVEDLSAFLRSLPAEVPVTWVGLGSNLLVRDGGIRGVVISVHGILNALERVGTDGVRAEAGVPCARLGRQCAKWQLGPADFFAGIPGTVGGALAMNAGAWGGETWPRVVEVETIDRAGERHRRAASEYRYGYRSVTPPVPGEWFLAATFRFEPRPDASTDSIKRLLEKRHASQPIGAWSCGSVFTNPPGGHAAELIDRAGLKGFRIGGAAVSEKHANFILNEGEATAADLEALVQPRAGDGRARARRPTRARSPRDRGGRMTRHVVAVARASLAGLPSLARNKADSHLAHTACRSTAADCCRRLSPARRFARSRVPPRSHRRRCDWFGARRQGGSPSE